MICIGWLGRLGGALEQWIAPLCLFASGVVWFGQKNTKGTSHEFVHERAGSFFGNHLGSITVFVGFLPLIAVWSGNFVQWSTMYSSLLGRIPWSDAVGYYGGVGEFLDKGELNFWTSRRPMNTLFLAVRYGFMGEWLEASLVIQALLAGIALFLATRKIWDYFGGASALFFFGLAYGFHRIFVPSTLSESLALTVGLLAVPLLLDGVYRRWLPSYLMAVLVLGLGQVIRPGAIFVLPALMICGYFLFAKKFRHRVLIVAAICFAAAVPFLANKVCLDYAPEGASPSVNLLWTLHGLTIGTDWKGGEESIRQILPEDGESKSEAVVRVSLENVWNQPGIFVQTLAYNMAYSLVRVPLEIGNSLFSLMVRKSGSGIPVLVLAGLLCILLFIPVIWEVVQRIRRKDLPYGLFWVVVVLFMVAAFPIIIRDGSFRVLAGTYPLFLVFGAAVLAGKQLHIREKPYRDYWVVSGLSSLVLLAPVLLAPVALAIHPALPNLESPAGRVVALRNEITAVVIDSASEDRPSIAQSFVDRVSVWDIEDYRHIVDASKVEMVDPVKNLEPPFTLALILEAETGRRKYLIFSGSVGPFREPAYEFELGETVGQWNRVIEYAPVRFHRDSE